MRRRPIAARLAFGALALSTLFACDGRMGLGGKKGESLTGPALVELNLTHGLSETGNETLFGSIPGTTFSDFARSLKELDPEDTKGVFVKLGGAHIGLSTANEAGRLLREVKDRGIPVYCHADDLANGTVMMTALGCTEIWLSPAGSVDTVGIAFQLMFGRDLLDRFKVGVDFLQVGKYKGAQEPYTRNEPTEEARSSMEGTLRDLRKAWIDGVVEGRGAKVESALEDGPHTGKAAIDLGLIDHIGYVDEARDKAKEAVGAERTVSGFGGRQAESGGFGDLMRSLSGSDPSSDPHVEIVTAVGPITMGGTGGLFGGSEGITETGLGKTITELTEDDSVKAVVLRIDSPGGSALASDLIWHKLMQLRAKKPLIISIGGMAASGGYYLSCAGSRIFAEPTSIVGSIGVVAGKLALKPALAEYGVHTVTITASPDAAKAARAAYLSPFDAWDDATRAKVLTSMEDVYSLFLDRIVEGRGVDRTEISKAAEGRIFGGSTAKDMKLVDELGGIEAATQYALEQASLGADGKVRVHQTPSGLAAMFSGDEEEAKALRSKALAEVDPVAKLGERLPVEARDWLGAVASLGQSERVMALVPYAIVRP